MKVGIVGAGTVGMAVAQGLVERGHDVYLNDPRIASIASEDEWNIATKAEMMQGCRVVFICVPTPAKPDGGCDLSIVYKVYSELHKAWTDIALSDEGLHATKHQPVIAVKSTVIPGTVDTLKAMYPWVCSNPEFMREKTALDDFLNPDRIIIGTDKEEVWETMLELYKEWEEEPHPILGEMWEKRIMINWVTPREAEAIKYFSNAFLVTKVAFSQEAKLLCDHIGVDSHNVMVNVCLDNRINYSHLDPTKGPIPKDTPCLVKDLKALIQAADMVGYDPWLLKASLYKGVFDSSITVKLEVK